MSEIPPDIASSAAQTGFQAREVAKARDARRSADMDAANRQSRSVSETDETVETTDGDTAVFSDSEGAGSQGRPFEDRESTEEDAALESGEEGVTRDVDGQLHLDLEA